LADVASLVQRPAVVQAGHSEQRPRWLCSPKPRRWNGPGGVDEHDGQKTSIACGRNRCGHRFVLPACPEPRRNTCRPRRTGFRLRDRGDDCIADTFEAGGVVQARTTATITARILAPVRRFAWRLVIARAGQVLIV
jgi:hypothetical protein